jgi:hypothetical protein
MSRIECAQHTIGTFPKGASLGDASAPPLLDEDGTKPELVKKALLAPSGCLRRQQIGKCLGVRNGHQEAYLWRS